MSTEGSFSLNFDLVDSKLIKVSEPIRSENCTKKSNTFEMFTTRVENLKYFCVNNLMEPYPK